MIIRGGKDDRRVKGRSLVRRVSVIDLYPRLVHEPHDGKKTRRKVIQ